MISISNKTFMYARVSTKEQSIERQILAFQEYCKLNNIDVDMKRDLITDKQSGKDFMREGYLMLKERLLRPGDTLIIKELDRLGRDMEMIKEEWRDLEKRGIFLEVIDTPILNTKNKSDLEKKLISTIVFELLSYMAEKERIKIKQRQAEGIAAMKVNKDGKKISNKTGNPIGRPIITFPGNWGDVYTKWKKGEITAKRAMELTGLKRGTFYKLVKEYETLIK